MFGERLKLILAEKNISQVQLAKTLKLSSQAVNRWCQNTTQPDHQTIVEIARILHVSTDFLLGNDSDYNNDDNALREKEALKKALVDNGYMNKDEDLSNEELDRLIKFVVNNKDFIKNCK